MVNLRNSHDWQNVCYNDTNMYFEEIRHFISCIENKCPPLISLLEAKNVLSIALAAKESAHTGKVVILE